MAKYSVTYSCGHTETKELYGAESERRSYIEWAAKSGSCAACAQAEKAGADLATEAEYDLPELTGSDKQVAWARKIRADLFRRIAEELTIRRANAIKTGKAAEYDERTGRMMRLLATETAARWWIDHKDDNSSTMMQGLFVRTA